MHMAFLNRGFKNLQWYGMTKRRDTHLCVFSFWRCTFAVQNQGRTGGGRPLAGFLLCVLQERKFPLDILKNENIMYI